MKTNKKNEIGNSDPNLSGLIEERALYLDDCITSEIDGDAEILSCYAYLRINGVPPNGITPIQLESRLLNRLYLDASALRTDPADILALKIYFGVVAGVIKLQYQPISLKLNRELYNAKMQLIGIYDINKFGNVFDYSGVAFNDTGITMPTNLESYKNNMTILRKKGKGFQSFQSNLDVEAVIFPFQEIFELLYDNSSSELDIYHCIRKFSTNENLEMKHSLILGSIGISPGVIEATFEKSYANLGHLCPPNCPSFIYQLETT